MEIEEFWKLMEECLLDSKGNQMKQEDLLKDRLFRYPKQDIVAFEIILRELLIKADDHKILTALKIIDDSADTDAYLYFRCWLVGKGRTVFEETLRNPDYLATLMATDSDLDFEGLLYIADEVYETKTGKKEDDSYPRVVAYDQGLDYDSDTLMTKGTASRDDELPALYPLLWQRFQG